MKKNASATKSTNDRIEETLNEIQFLSTWLDTSTILAFSVTCKTAQRMSLKALNQHLLTAVVCGDEDLSKKIIRAYPELLLDSSATAIDLSGKEIKNLTALQAAICAGDVGMVEMIKQVLQKKLERGVKLSFNPLDEIKRQILIIYPEGIDVVQNEQKRKADKFKDNLLEKIFAAINAATNEQITYELNFPGLTIKAIKDDVRFERENPGSISPRRRLNATLHYFRAKVTATSNKELIFNPFYLQKAFEFYKERFAYFSGVSRDAKWDRRDLFWRQVIGYIQRHLPACYLQRFAHRLGLNRDFEFLLEKGQFMRPLPHGSLNNLGYDWAGGVMGNLTPVCYRSIL